MRSAGKLFHRLRSAVCKKTWYCGLECQKAGWKNHNDTRRRARRRCQNVRATMWEALDAEDWRGVPEWKDRMDAMLEGRPDAERNASLGIFITALESS